MNDRIIVAENLEVTIRKLIQWHTYAGLLEGLPTRQMNITHMESAKEQAKEMCFVNSVYLLEPEQTPIQYTGKYPFGEPASLPNVTCIALLHYHRGVRDTDKDFSQLALVWFQDTYAFPINPAILERLKHIPFSQICDEFSY